MNFNLDSHTCGAVRFIHAVPPAFTKWAIRGSRPYTSREPLDSIFLQQGKSGSANISCTICPIQKDLALDFTISGSPSPVWLNGNIIETMNETKYIMEEGIDRAVTFYKIAKQV